MGFETLHDFFAIPSPTRDSQVRFWRDGSWAKLSARELRKNICHLAAAILNYGLEPGASAAVLCDDGPEAFLAEAAIMVAGGVAVTLPPALDGDGLGTILRASTARHVLVSDVRQLRRIIVLRPDLPDVDLVLLFRGADAEGRAAATLVDSAMQVGASLLAQDPAFLSREAKRRTRDAPASLVYPEGRETKSFLLSQGNVLGAADALASLLKMESSDVVFLAHDDGPAFRRTSALASLAAGADLAIAPTTVDIAGAMRELAPTLALVHREVLVEHHRFLRERIEKRGLLGRAIARWAVEEGGKQAAPGLASGRIEIRKGPWAHRIADRIVLRGLRAETGSRLRSFVSEGTPLPSDVSTFLFAVGLPVLEGCEAPESSGLLAMNTSRALRLGTVGVPVPGVEVRIGSGGRIEVRGPLAGTAAGPHAGSAPPGGWIPTGRFGRLEESGYLVVFDPKDR